MKIWFQSCGAIGKDPLWSPYEKALKEHAGKVARPDTVVELHGQEATIPGIDRYYASRNVCAVQSIKNAIRAEREGFDAFVHITTTDAGSDEIRELVDIPVIFMLESSVHLAMTLAPKFAFFGHNNLIMAQMQRQAKQYGLTENMVEGGYLEGVSYMTFGDMYGNPEKHVDTVTQKIKGIVANGANVIISGALPLGVWLAKQGITELEGACVLDTFGYIIKQAELMVDLKKMGIKRSKYGPPQKDMLKAMQKLYLP